MACMHDHYLNVFDLTATICTAYDGSSPKRRQQQPHQQQGGGGETDRELSREKLELDTTKTNKKTRTTTGVLWGSRYRKDEGGRETDSKRDHECRSSRLVRRRQRYENRRPSVSDAIAIYTQVLFVSQCVHDTPLAYRIQRNGHRVYHRSTWSSFTPWQIVAARARPFSMGLLGFRDICAKLKRGAKAQPARS